MPKSMTASHGSGATRATISFRSPGSPPATIASWFAAIPHKKLFRHFATKQAGSSVSSRSTGREIICSAVGCWPPMARSRRSRRPIPALISRARWLQPSVSDLDPRLEFLPDGFDVRKRWQSGFVAEALDFVSRCRARELEVLMPAFAGVGEIGVDISAVEDIPGAVGVEHALARDWKRG